jgi:glycogen synthase
MAKEAVTITIDSHLHQWIKEKGGNKSRVVNTLLHQCWINQRDKPRESPLLLRKRTFDDKWKQLEELLDKKAEVDKLET